MESSPPKANATGKSNWHSQLTPQIDVDIISHSEEAYTTEMILREHPEFIYKGSKKSVKKGKKKKMLSKEYPFQSEGVSIIK